MKLLGFRPAPFPITVTLVREPAPLELHWCENQTIKVALIREPAPLQSHWCENQTIAVALVREPAPFQSHWCENQTISCQCGSLPRSRQAFSVTLNAALTRYRTSARTGSDGRAREITKGCGAAEIVNRLSTHPNKSSNHSKTVS